MQKKFLSSLTITFDFNNRDILNSYNSDKPTMPQSYKLDSPFEPS